MTPDSKEYEVELLEDNDYQKLPTSRPWYLNPAFVRFTQEYLKAYEAAQQFDEAAFALRELYNDAEKREPEKFGYVKKPEDEPKTKRDFVEYGKDFYPSVSNGNQGVFPSEERSRFESSPNEGRFLQMVNEGFYEPKRIDNIEIVAIEGQTIKIKKKEKSV